MVKSQARQGILAGDALTLALSRRERGPGIRNLQESRQEAGG